MEDRGQSWVPPGEFTNSPAEPLFDAKPPNISETTFDGSGRIIVETGTITPNIINDPWAILESIPSARASSAGQTPATLAESQGQLTPPSEKMDNLERATGERHKNAMLALRGARSLDPAQRDEVIRDKELQQALEDFEGGLVIPLYIGDLIKTQADPGQEAAAVQRVIANFNVNPDGVISVLGKAGTGSARIALIKIVKQRNNGDQRIRSMAINALADLNEAGYRRVLAPSVSSESALIEKEATDFLRQLGDPTATEYNNRIASVDANVLNALINRMPPDSATTNALNSVYNKMINMGLANAQ